MFDSATRDAPDLDSLPSEVMSSGRPEPVNVLCPRMRRKNRQVPGVEEPSESDGSGIPPDAAEGVAHDVGRSGEAESGESVQDRLVASGELHRNTLPTAVSQLAAN